MFPAPFWNSRLSFLFVMFAIGNALIMASCEQQSQGSSQSSDTTVSDPHSFSKPLAAVVTHLDLNAKVDFSTREISGTATWTIENISKSNEIIFDSRGLVIKKVTLDDGTETKFSLGSEKAFMGTSLSITITSATKKLSIYYSSGKNAGALQWLEPQQTAGKKQPFLFTQSEPVLARTWIPCQDGPGIRFTYEATITVPSNLMAVMSSGENPAQKTTDGVYHFRQTHPIPSYLVALAVGDLAFKAIDSRTGIYAEPSMLDRAAWEFADMGKMVDAAEKIYGPYRWGRYDLLVLPPSFPYGGMENPNLTFATPTVIAGDRSLVSLVAHELAHSWSGNLVTNATWNDMWLNEGFTTYFERRIIEAVYGKEEAAMQEVLGRQLLAEAVAQFGDTSINTALKGHFEGRDPDENSSDIPYEKGCAFLRTVEKSVGRERFDSFVKAYFDKYAFQSKTTEQFLEYFNTHLVAKDTGLAAKIRAEEWIYKAGIPSNVPPAVSNTFKKIDTLLTAWNAGGVATGLHKQIKSTNELLYFISHLPVNTDASAMAILDKEFNFTNSGNAEVQCAWYTLAIRYGYQPADANIEKFLVNVGRRKFLRPLYKELIKTPEGRQKARTIYAKARPTYHPVAYTTIDELLK